jgi:hypothetical protein
MKLFLLTALLLLSSCYTDRSNSKETLLHEPVRDSEGVTIIVVHF